MLNRVHFVVFAGTTYFSITENL